MDSSNRTVSFAAPRGFGTTLKSDLKETFFPDDPFKQFENQKPLGKVKKGLQYLVPICEWLPKYTLKTFQYDVLAGITITSLAIPQGISYAKLGQLPPIVGLYSSFVPPIIYAIFGDSKYIAVGTVAACSLLIAEIIGEVASPKTEPALYLHLVFTATFVTGIMQTLLGVLRLGILVDFLSHSTITGFMGGTAVIICLQQLKGMLGLKNFTTKTDVVNVLRAVFEHRKERDRKPKLFWVSAMSPLVVVVSGCLFAYFAHAQDHGIPIVGDLKRGINPPSIQFLNFDRKYFPHIVKAGAITGMIALAVVLGLVRALLYVARPGTCKLGRLPDSVLYRDIEQYPDAARNSGIIVLQIGSPIYFANGNYVRERVLRWVRDEQSHLETTGDELQHVVLELSGVVTIDMTGLETLKEINKTLRANDVKLGIINPRLKVMEKMITSHFIDKLGKENVYLSIEEAIENCKFSTSKPKKTTSESGDSSKGAEDASDDASQEV
ncbi:hypothetical protein ACE6H2_025362 [Prunus campanulata]